MAKKVLIVDDSALVRKQLKEIISTLDMEIDIAKNGKEAVDKAAVNDYDVITMDINMPVMSGLELIEELKKQTLRDKNDNIIFSNEIFMSCPESSLVDGVNKGSSNLSDSTNPLGNLIPQTVPSFL